GATTQPGAFTITYDGVAQPAPTSVSITGSTVVLGLASPPNNSQTVKFRYAQPSSAAERLRDQATPAANETPSFGPEAVVNATPDTVAPSVLSTSVNADTLTILFD